MDLKCSLEVNGLKTWSPVLVPWEGTETFKRQDLVEWKGMRTLELALTPVSFSLCFPVSMEQPDLLFHSLPPCCAVQGQG